MRKALTIASALFLGLILLVAGTGKLPGQAEFIDALLQSFWTPSMAFFIARVVPWVEIALGVLLLLGMASRTVAAFCLPLVGGFIANNVWALGQGIEQFPQCGQCFGIWETYLGTISPAQALTIDVALMVAAVTVLAFEPRGWFNLRPWFIPQRGGKKAMAVPRIGGVAGMLLAVSLLALPFFLSACEGNHPTTISRITITPEQVSRNGIAQIECVAQDPDGDELNYTWVPEKGKITGKGPVVTYQAPAAAGTYNIQVIIGDGRGGGTTQQFTITVTDNRSPIINKIVLTNTMSTERPVIKIVTNAILECQATDPDGELLTYAWSAPRGNVTGDGAKGTWLAPNSVGDYTVSVTVTDSRGGKARKEITIFVCDCCCH